MTCTQNDVHPTASVATVEVVEAAAAVAAVAVVVVLVEVQPRSVEALVVANASSSRVPVRPRRPSSFVSGTLGVGGLGNVAIFDLDFDAILAAMYALTDSAEGGYYLSVPPDPGIAAAALGASASAAPGTSESAAPGARESALSGTAPTMALHTFTLDSGASRSFFRDSTTPTPLSRPVAVSLADPSGGPVLAHSSTVLPLPSPRRACCRDSTSPRSLQTCKSEVPEVLIDWIRNAHRQLSKSFGSDLPVLRLHSDRGGEFSSYLLRAFCRSEGIR
ncbi:unnamed protein product [Closterium sp. NIES-54]